MTLLKMYAITAIVLTLKMAAISIVQASGRIGNSTFVNPEDAQLFQVREAPAEAPSVERAAKAWRNDLENIPIFLILGLIYVAAALPFTAFAIYCVIFMLGRILHTICYLNSIQPMRTIAYFIGLLAMMAMVVHIFVGVVLA
jgi:uncharacterized MAPEG superfamily protein